MRRRVPQLCFTAALLMLCATPRVSPRAHPLALSGGPVSLTRPADASASDAAAGVWLGVRTRHFRVVGQAGGREMRRAAARLEQYRAVFARLLSGEHFDASVPTTVIIFRDDASYAPFKPLFHGREAAGVAGHFQPSPGVNYITLSLDAEAARDSSTLLHEYVHLLVNNYLRHAPLWVKEGLAEYYSTARLSGDRRKATLGLPVRAHAHVMRTQAPLPLGELFAVTQHSPHYVEPDKRRLFYAQSWSLVHHLLGGERRRQFTRHLELLGEGAPAEEAFKQAFQTDYAGMGREFAAHARAALYRERVETFDTALEFDAEARAVVLADAEVFGTLGDLLVHAERTEAAEALLRKALERDAGLASAHASLGLLRLRQSRFAEARAHLARAVEADPQSHLARYYLADALNREGLGMNAEDVSVKGFEEKTALIRAELRRAIELAPDFVESYRLLALVELDRGGRADVAHALLTRALVLAPRRHELTLLLAQAHLGRGELAEARGLCERVARRAGDASLHAEAERLLGLVAAREAHASRALAAAVEATRGAASAASQTSQPCDMPDPGPQFKKLRFSGRQACGRLVEIECADASVVFHLAAGGRALRLRAEALNRVRFVTYTTEVKTGHITCGPRDPAPFALVTYRPEADAAHGFDGDALAVEFIPPDWHR